MPPFCPFLGVLSAFNVVGVEKAKSLILRAYRGEKSKFCYTQKRDISLIYSKYIS